MLKTALFGASGYTGAQLAELVLCHPELELSSVWVSDGSEDAGKPLSDLYPAFHTRPDLVLQAADDDSIKTIGKSHDVVFLATPHKASHDWLPVLVEQGAMVFDLSGAFRLAHKKDYATHYGFEHEHTTLLSRAVYGLAEWNNHALMEAPFVAVPGCYPTASLLALKPLVEHELLMPDSIPIINAVSGVSGAGRKANLTNSFCEVSLQAYGIFSHRHTPEIAQCLGKDVVFTPHLGSFKRGILATITAQVKPGVTANDITLAIQDTYSDAPLLRLLSASPKLDNVVGTPFCDLYWQFQPNTSHVILVSAIDNVMKGAASQAIQCVNLRYGWPTETGLLAYK